MRGTAEPLGEPCEEPLDARGESLEAFMGFDVRPKGKQRSFTNWFG